MRAKILFTTHKISKQIIKEFENLRDTYFDVMMLYNGYDNEEIPTPNFCCTNEDIWNLKYPVISDQMIDHTYFPILYYFSKENEKYDYYWVVEYDVRYTGDWSKFFSKFKKEEADLITSHIRFYEDEPGWLGWDQIIFPDNPIELENRVRSFNPIYRISKRALEFILQKLQAGYAGHFEVLFPTLIYYHEDFTMLDFGGNGKFVEGKSNINYISRSNKDGEIFGGTFRYRPTMRKAGLRKNKLYHPIKNDSSINLIGLLKFADKYLKNICELIVKNVHFKKYDRYNFLLKKCLFFSIFGTVAV